jgi:hypothetical protein
MSKINGEKARANIARRRRTAQREKDRARLAEIKTNTESKSSDKTEAAAK